MLNVEYYFDQNRKMPYIQFCGMMLPFFILKNKSPFEINLNYDVRETEALYNDLPSKVEIERIVEKMKKIYDFLSSKYISIKENKDFRENLVIAYAYQELAEQIGPQIDNIEQFQFNLEDALNSTKLYCALAGLSTSYANKIEEAFKKVAN